MSRGGSSDPLFCHTARWGVTAGISSLIGEAVGCVGACSMVACSDGLELPIVIGSTSEVALQVHSN